MGGWVASPQSRGQGGLCGADFLPLCSPSYPTSVSLGSTCNPALASEVQVNTAGGSVKAITGEYHNFQASYHFPSAQFIPA